MTLFSLRSRTCSLRYSDCARPAVWEPQVEQAAERDRGTCAGANTGACQPVNRAHRACGSTVHLCAAYIPTTVYGGWSYPAYPPYYWKSYPAYYPGAALATGFAWGVGLVAAGAIFGSANWGHGDVNINFNKAANIDRYFYR